MLKLRDRAPGHQPQLSNLINLTKCINVGLGVGAEPQPHLPNLRNRIYLIHVIRSVNLSCVCCDPLFLLRGGVAPGPQPHLSNLINSIYYKQIRLRLGGVCSRAPAPHLSNLISVMNLVNLITLSLGDGAPGPQPHLPNLINVISLSWGSRAPAQFNKFNMCNNFNKCKCCWLGVKLQSPSPIYQI